MFFFMHVAVLPKWKFKQYFLMFCFSYFRAINCSSAVFYRFNLKITDLTSLGESFIFISVLRI